MVNEGYETPPEQPVESGDPTSSLDAPATPPVGPTAPGAPQPGSPTSGAPTKFCFACGAVLDARAEMCPKCGVRQQPPPAQSIDAALGRSRVVAALLGIFLGAFGIHKFYLGRIAQGVIYLVFFWTAIPAIVGFFEGIWYLTMSDQDFQRRYPR